MKKEQYLQKQKEMHLRRWFVVNKNMAQTRGQAWLITLDEFAQLWCEDDRWLKRGRGSSDLCLARRDMTGDWTINNVEIITRKTMLQRESKIRWDKN